MRFVCVFEVVYVCVCAGQSKTGFIVKAFETLLRYARSLARRASAKAAAVKSPRRCRGCPALVRGDTVRAGGLVPQ